MKIAINNPKTAFSFFEKERKCRHNVKQRNKKAIFDCLTLCAKRKKPKMRINKTRFWIYAKKDGFNGSKKFFGKARA
jgi:hypothetical protein